MRSEVVRLINYAASSKTNCTQNKQFFIQI